jgi:hypothetical protein
LENIKGLKMRCIPLVVALAFGVVSMGAQARGYAPVVSPLPTGFQIKYASNGTPLATLTNGAAGVVVAGAVPIPLSASVVLNAAATGAISGASFGGAWGAALGGLGAVALVAIPAFAVMNAQLRLKVNPETGKLEHASDVVCPDVSQCPEYAWPTTGYGAGSSPIGSLAGACNFGMKYKVEAGWATTTPLPPSQCQMKAANGYVLSTYSMTVTKAPQPPGPYVPITDVAATDLVSARSPTAAEVQALVDAAFPPVVEMKQLSGPAELPLFNTVHIDAAGVKTTVEESATFSYFPDSVAMKKKTKTTVDTPAVAPTPENPSGTPAKSVVTGTTETTEKPKDTTTCGLPTTPPCKMDETGTPEVPAENKFSPKLDKVKTDQDALRTTAGGNADKGFFSNWQSFFVTPPLATCAVYELPNSMGSINPCPVVDGVRSFMAFLWAVTALWSGIRMVREVV